MYKVSDIEVGDVFVIGDSMSKFVVVNKKYNKEKGIYDFEGKSVDDDYVGPHLYQIIDDEILLITGESNV